MARSPFLFNTHDLPRRAGEMREYSLNITEHEPLGYDLVSIRKNEPISITLRIESVSEGVLASGEVESLAEAECGRCLEAIEYEIDERFTELFLYEPENKRGKKPDKKSAKNEDDLDDEVEVRYMDGNEIDLDGPIRDVIILNLPQNPLCKPDCKGLCPDCGEKLENLPPDHAHEKVDARWAALGDLAKKLDQNKRD